jgi:hypothetical protein
VLEVIEIKRYEAEGPWTLIGGGEFAGEEIF